jgi:hypothetical protein
VEAMRSLPLVAPLIAALFLGCAPLECSTENLPHEGHAYTPKELVDLVQYEARHSCKGELYDLLSKRSVEEIERQGYGRTTWRLGIGSQKVPGHPGDYLIMDVLEKGQCNATIVNSRNPDEAFAFLDYSEPGKEPLYLRMLLVKETPKGSDRREWRIGLQDQTENIKHDPETYWYFDH